MDKIVNPFSPGAGSPPPELAGREAVLEQARVLLARLLAKRPEKSLLLTGLRGVGKTVLLNEMERIALAAGYRTILVEAHEGKPLAASLVPHLRRLLFDLDCIAGVGNKARRGLAVLKSFVSAIKIKVGDVDIGLDIEPEPGAADSGDLEVDLPGLFVAIAEAAQERRMAVAILIDEIQYFTSSELSALIMAMHKMQQRQLPLVLIGAGLPILPGLAGESKSYAERLFNFPAIGPLPERDAITALQDPVRAAGEAFEPAALQEIFSLTKGYPYFLQGWGYRAWGTAHHTARWLSPYRCSMNSCGVPYRNSSPDSERRRPNRTHDAEPRTRPGVELGYRTLRDWTDRADNSDIENTPLTTYLAWRWAGSS